MLFRSVPMPTPRNPWKKINDSTAAMMISVMSNTAQIAALLADENGTSADGDTWVKTVWRDYVLGGGAALAEPENYITLR